MQEVFEEIIEKLEEMKEFHIANAEKPYGDKSYENLADRCKFRAYGVKDAIEIVNQVAAEYNNGWVPVEESLPEDGEEVLVTNGKYVYLVEYDADLDACFGDMDGIIAWQPLPEPYQPEGE